MKHLTQEKLIEYHYGEISLLARFRVQRHLRSCSACAQAYAELAKDLQSVEAITTPAHDADYGEHVWQAIRDTLPGQEHSPQFRRFPLDLRWRSALAGVAALLLVGAFYAGRRWEHRHTPPTIAAHPQQPTQHVIVVLADHLERSERLLVSLNHADISAVAGPVLQAEARSLHQDNELWRKNASTTDPTLAAALDRLDRVLAEVASRPEGIRPADLIQLQEELNTGDLLFEIRVLRSRTINRTQGGDAARREGTL